LRRRAGRIRGSANVSAQIVLPPGVRHGTAFAMPPELLGSLQW